MLALLLWCIIGVRAADLPAELVSMEDPRQLEAAADLALAAGDLARAELVYKAMFEREELRTYVDFREGVKRALLLERLGRYDEARELHRAAIRDDVLRSIQALRLVSVHPERDALVAEATAYVRTLAQQAADDGQSTDVVYVTSKGAPKRLTTVTTEQVLDASRRGARVDYCFIDRLDLREADLTGIEEIQLERCVIGSLAASEVHIPKFVLRSIVLGDADFGKTWTGAKNSSSTSPAGTFGDLMLRDAVFLGAANLSGIEVTGRGRGYFPLTVFDGPVDFSGAEFSGIAEFRYAAFGAGANFRQMRVAGTTYFMHARFRGDTVFSGLHGTHATLFASARFEAATRFDGCEWLDLVTFEDAHFAGPATFASSRVPNKRLNLSRARFADTVTFEEMEIDGLDAFGTHFGGRAAFTDTTIGGRARFSVDRVSRETFAHDPDGLRVLYRDYQGDEDAEAPLTVKNSYGVRGADDLTARVEGDITFANTAFQAYTVFEGVQFGLPGRAGTASFYNAQFLGETHFERTIWHARADFRTIFGKEIAFNEALFHHELVLDDAYVDGRLTFTDAVFQPGATWSSTPRPSTSSSSKKRTSTPKTAATACSTSSVPSGGPIPPTHASATSRTRSAGRPATTACSTSSWA